MAKPIMTAAALALMLTDLKAGEVILVKASKTKTDKIQLEFAERIEASGFESGVQDALASFNSTDPRFARGARRAWITATVEDTSRLLGINCGDDANWETDSESGKEVLYLGIKNPKINDQRLRVQILETVTPDEWQSANILSTVKRRGKDGEPILHNGCYIFSNTRMVTVPEGTAVPHTRLAADAPVAKGVKATSHIAAVVNEVGY